MAQTFELPSGFSNVGQRLCPTFGIDQLFVGSAEQLNFTTLNTAANWDPIARVVSGLPRVSGAGSQFVEILNFDPKQSSYEINNNSQGDYTGVLTLRWKGLAKEIAKGIAQLDCCNALVFLVILSDGTQLIGGLDAPGAKANTKLRSVAHIKSGGVQTTAVKGDGDGAYSSTVLTAELVGPMLFGDLTDAEIAALLTIAP